MLYIIIFFIFLCLTIFELKCYKKDIYFKYKKIIFFSIILLLICVAGFRRIGSDNDSDMYFKLFESLKEISYYEILFHNQLRIKETGYLLLNKVFSSLDFRFFLITCAIISIGIKAYVFYRYTCLPILTIFIYYILFYYLREITQIRDALATSFIILCILMYLKKKYLYSILLFLIGLSFHIIALVCLAIILLWEIYKYKKEIVYFFLIIFLILKCLIPNLNYLNSSIFPYQLTKYFIINFKTGYFLPAISLFILLLLFKRKYLKDKFIFFLSLLTFVGYIYSLGHMALIRIPNILFFGNIILLGNFNYVSTNSRYIILFILSFYFFYNI